jgi:hypothetical protein
MQKVSAMKLVVEIPENPAPSYKRVLSGFELFYNITGVKVLR